MGTSSFAVKVGAGLGFGIGVLFISLSSGKIDADSVKIRNPASATSLLEWEKKLVTSALAQPITPDNCESYFEQVTEEILRVEPSKFELREIESQSESVVKDLFGFRMSLLDRARPILLGGTPYVKCALRMRRALRHIRGVEDYVGSIGYVAVNQRKDRASLYAPPQYHDPSMDNARIAPRVLPQIETPFPTGGTIAGPSFVPHNILLNPSLSSPPGVRSGDVLLSRGNAAASALIARMADEDTQFSHMGLVYINPRDQSAWTIEAHIEFGSIIIPLKDWMSDGKSRTMIFRYGDAKVAHEAAEKMYNKVFPPFNAGKSIEYDFPFNMDEHTKLFCSEVVREGYEYASKGKVLVPLFPSRIAMKNDDLMKRLGISQTASFIPADIELDPRFTVIGEWRNFRKISDVWEKDAILTSIYKWVDQDGYKFDSNMGLKAKGILARGLRKIGFIKEKMPTYMTQDVVVLNFMVDSMTEEFQARLLELNKAQKARTGFPMTYYDVIRELEAMKKAEAPSGKGPFRYLHP